MKGKKTTQVNPLDELLPTEIVLDIDELVDSLTSRRYIKYPKENLQAVDKRSLDLEVPLGLALFTPAAVYDETGAKNYRRRKSHYKYIKDDPMAQSIIGESLDAINKLFHNSLYKGLTEQEQEILKAQLPKPKPIKDLENKVSYKMPKEILELLKAHNTDVGYQKAIVDMHVFMNLNKHLKPEILFSPTNKFFSSLDGKKKINHALLQYFYWHSWVPFGRYSLEQGKVKIHPVPTEVELNQLKILSEKYFWAKALYHVARYETILDSGIEHDFYALIYLVIWERGGIPKLLRIAGTNPTKEGLVEIPKFLIKRARKRPHISTYTVMRKHRNTLRQLAIKYKDSEDTFARQASRLVLDYLFNKKGSTKSIAKQLGISDRHWRRLVKKIVEKGTFEIYTPKKKEVPKVTALELAALKQKAGWPNRHQVMCKTVLAFLNGQQIYGIATTNNITLDTARRYIDTWVKGGIGAINNIKSATFRHGIPAIIIQDLRERENDPRAKITADVIEQKLSITSASQLFHEYRTTFIDKTWDLIEETAIKLSDKLVSQRKRAEKLAQGIEVKEEQQ